MITRRHTPDTRAGWRIELKQVFDPARLDKSRRPLLMIPGYGMNNFILGFHPNGLSMEGYLVDQGFEVWSVNMRGQGGAKRYSGSHLYGFRELALTDLPCALDVVLEETETGHDRIDPIGCSLGATVLYAYLAHNPVAHPFGSLVAIGGPLRWEDVHPAVKLAFTSTRLAGALPLRGTRKMARAVLPVARRMPGMLSIYMNASICDLSAASEMVKTVENPNRKLNSQIAKWIKGKDLVVAGVNVTESLAEVDLPLYCVLANADGIVTPASALSVKKVLGEDRVDVLNVGNDDTWFAHADLFVSDHAQRLVFEPLSAWLEAHQ